MKILRYIFGFLFMFLLSSSVVLGAESNSFKIDDYMYGESIDSVKESNQYLFSEKIDVLNNIKGDFYGAGMFINILDKVSDDLVLAGHHIVIDGEIGGDVRIFANSLDVKENIGGELIYFGQTINIASGVVVGDDVMIQANETSLYGSFSGNVDVVSNSVDLGANILGDLYLDSYDIYLTDTTISGSLDYSFINRIEALESLVDEENINFESKSRGDSFDDFFEMDYSNILFDIFKLFIFGSIFVFVFSNFLKKTVQNLKSSLLKSAIIGFLMYGLGWVIGLALLVTIFGWALGTYALIVYIFMWIFVDFINVVVYSSLLIDILETKFDREFNKLMSVGVVLLVSFLIAIIPVLNFFMILFAMGAIVISLWQILKDNVL